jgi:2-aminoethylphosphonate-pyruvate transaminase
MNIVTQRPAQLLLNPGPVTLSPRVRRALTQPDLCHREDDFIALFQDVRSRLGCVYPACGTGYTSIILTGSGTAAVEAMISALVPADRTALVAANGVYGERIGAMLDAQRKRSVIVRSPWLEGVDLSGVKQALDADSSISHVVAVHHETTTGRLNDIASLGALCRQRGVKLLLDAVSSFGAEDIRFAEWNLEACAATANKCLHGVPGVSFVLADETVFTQRPSAATSLYLDLYRYYGMRDGAPPFTPAVHALYGLQEALREFEERGGWQERHRRYLALSHRVRVCLAENGIRTLLDDQAAYSCVLVSYYLPDGLHYEILHDALKEQGFVIYAGQGNFDGKIFRVATMGAIEDGDIDRFLEEIRLVLKRCTRLRQVGSDRDTQGSIAQSCGDTLD